LTLKNSSAKIEIKVYHYSIDYGGSVPVLQFNQATDYAFRVVLHLACLPQGAIVNGQTLAEKEKIPQRFLLKIMRSLTAAGIIKSYRGVDGGFALAQNADRITLLAVIEAMEGKVAVHRCLNERDACTKFCTHECPVHHALAGVQAQFVTSLGSINFAELARKRTGREGGESSVC